MMMWWWLLLPLLIVLIIFWSRGRTRTRDNAGGQSAQSILEKKLARGEISEEEYNKRKNAMDNNN
jgi:putative membrane protein